LMGDELVCAGQFVLTSDAHELVPHQLRGYFQPAGSYEGRRLHRMLRPSSASGMREAGNAWAG